LSSQKRMRQRAIRALMAKAGLTYTQAARELNRRCDPTTEPARPRRSPVPRGITGLQALSALSVLQRVGAIPSLDARMLAPMAAVQNAIRTAGPSTGIAATIDAIRTAGIANPNTGIAAVQNAIRTVQGRAAGIATMMPVYESALRMARMAARAQAMYGQPDDED
jgi:hypothetical protein